VLGRCSVASGADVRNPRALVASCSFAGNKAPSSTHLYAPCLSASEYTIKTGVESPEKTSSWL
jgi:hypothetical protein